MMKVSMEDIEKLVEGNREFDLLVIGLQEVPRINVSRLLKNALSDIHMYVSSLLLPQSFFLLN